jgi:hypothetical protein
MEDTPLCAKSPAYIKLVYPKGNTANPKSVRRYRNMYSLTFRRKNLLSPRQMSPNRISVQPFIMATSHTATDSFKRWDWTRSESSEIYDTGEFVAGRLPSLCSAEQRHGGHNFQDNGEVEVLLHEL